MPPLKGLYFTSVNRDELRNKRIIDKCLGQIDCFAKKDWHTDFISQSDNGLLYNGNKIGIKGSNRIVKWVQEKAFTLLGNFREVKNICTKEKYDYIYFRHSFFNPAALRFFKRVKKVNPQTIIIVEISTFPYQQEFKGFVKSMLSWVDRLSAVYLRNNVDYIASCSPDKKILKIPVLHFSNGLMHMAEVIKNPKKDSDVIKMVAIASNISYWHGFDRIIEGIKNYQTTGQTKIQFDIIGEGTAKKELQQQVEQYGLQDIVYFIDKIPNEEVIDRLRQYDLGFSTLGMLRKGVQYDSSMKSRDYAYAGLPFILCTPDASFDVNGPYWKYAPDTDDAIDIEGCIQFLTTLKADVPNYHEELCNMAMAELGWESTFKSVVETINNFALKPYKQQQLNSFCYYFPPIKAIGSIRNYSFTQQMMHSGYDTTVYSTTNADLCFTNENLFEEYIATNKIATLDFRTIADRPRKKNGNNGSGQISTVKAILLKILNSFPMNIIIGEGGLVYILKGYWMAKKQIGTSSIIYSSFRPYADHIIAYLLKRKFKNIYWIADFRDLHYDKHINDFYFGGLQNWFNKMVLKKASLVTTISIGLQEKLMHYHQDVYVLRNGIIEQSNEQAIDSYDKFTINYTGSLYEGKRDSKLLFAAVKKLIDEKKIDSNQIQLQYAGQHGALWDNWIKEFGLTGINKSLDMVTTKQAMEMQTRSHINLLLSWSSPEVSGILTGKFYEYLKTENPVILIINGIQDKEFEAVFEETNCGQVFYNSTDLKVIEEYLLSLYNHWTTDRHLTSFRENVHNDKYKWPQLIADFIGQKL